MKRFYDFGNPTGNRLYTLGFSLMRLNVATHQPIT